MKLKKSKEDKHNFSLYIPKIIIKNWDINEKGNVLIDLTIKNPVTKCMGWLINKSPKKDIELDKLGSLAWINIDGEKCIFEIAREMKKGTGEEFSEAMRRVAEFIKFLAKKGWIKYEGIKNKNDIVI